ncbi:MAG: glycosyltransferase family 4 protein [Candidatus Omnitrophica bacterium]|nr:glycosyltransferase family 4 protein [Candidatus Omnitrophota bacterium]
MNLLILSPYPREGASFRFRILQYLPYLESQGIQCTVRCFLSSAEFAQVHLPRHYLAKGKALASGTMRLAASLSAARRFDLILVHRELYPLGLDGFERWLERSGRPVVLDVDDAIFLPQPHSNRVVRQFHNPAKLMRLAAVSRLVIVSNEYLARWFRRHTRAVAVIPTAVDTDRFRPPAERPSGPLTVGWIGSPSTSDYLQPLVPVLKRLAQARAFEMKVVGAGPAFQSNGVPVVRVPWRLDREVEDFQSLHIGVYPLPDDPWAEGKGGFKTIQYMAVGVPVVASAVGVNRDIIRDGENGFLAADEAQWIGALSRLLDDALLRERIGRAGRQTAESAYSVAVHASRLAAVLRQALDAA